MILSWLLIFSPLNKFPRCRSLSEVYVFQFLNSESWYLSFSYLEVYLRAIRLYLLNLPQADIRRSYLSSALWYIIQTKLSEQEEDNFRDHNPCGSCLTLGVVGEMILLNVVTYAYVTKFEVTITTPLSDERADWKTLPFVILVRLII